MTKQDRGQDIEGACAALAAALVRLVAAVGRQEAATGAPAKTVASEATQETLRSVADDPSEPADHLVDPGEPGGGGRRINVYLAGSRGCGLLAVSYGAQIKTALGLTTTPYVIKCGTTTGTLTERLRQIGQDRYGAAVRTNNGIELEPGFNAWIAHTISTTREPNDPTISLMPRFIAVDLPSGLSRRTFDAALHRALRTRSLSTISSTVMPRRFVAYDLVEMRVNAAKEFYALSPHNGEDGDLLLGAIEDILRCFRAQRA